MASDSGQIGCVGVETPFLRFAALHEKYKGLEPKTCDVWDLLIFRAVYWIRGDFVLSPFLPRGFAREESYDGDDGEYGDQNPPMSDSGDDSVLPRGCSREDGDDDGDDDGD